MCVWGGILSLEGEGCPLGGRGPGGEGSRGGGRSGRERRMGLRVCDPHLLTV